MSFHLDRPLVVTLRPPLTAGALALCMLLFACATGRSIGAPPPSTWEAEETSETEEAHGASAEEVAWVHLSTDFPPTQVPHREFVSALEDLLLNMPLRIAPAHQPLQAGRRFALGASSLQGESDVVENYGHWCERRGTPGDCLDLSEDAPYLDASDKRRIAFALAVAPAMEGALSEARTTLNPARVAAMLSISMAVYLTLLVAPEPISKGAVAAFSLLLWGYLGWELWDLIEGWMQLTRDSAQATTFSELRTAGDRFGERMGPKVVRVLILVGTAAVGETAALVSSASQLPRIAEVSRVAEIQGGVQAVAAAAEAERIFVFAQSSGIRVVAAPHVLSTAGRGVSSRLAANNPASNQASANTAEKPPLIYRAFRSFKSFKRAMGPAGGGKAWHHIVEQTPGNVKRFGPEALHNTENVKAIDAKVHDRISAYYSSKQEITDNMVVREWLRTKPYEVQRDFGLMIMKDFGAIP